MSNAPDKQHFRYVVLGAGPAGLQMAYFLQQAGLDHVVLERAEEAGSFFRTQPRSRELISFNKTHTLFDDPEIQLRWDWNCLLTHDYSSPFSDYSDRLFPHADELVHYLTDFRKAHDLHIRFGTDVVRVTRTEDGRGTWRIRTADDAVLGCDVLIVAIGLSQPYIPDIPGIEHAVGYEEVPFESEWYAGQRVLVIGKGNSGMEVADAAMESAAIVHLASPTPLTLALSSRHPGHARSNHSNILDAYHLKTLHSLLNCEIRSIEPLGQEANKGPYLATVAYTRADGETDELVYDRVVRATGFRFDSAPFEPAPETVLDGRLPDITPYWESTSHPDLFFAGTLMQARDFKRSASAFIDGFRYNIRTLFHHLLARYEDRPFPSTRLAGGARELADAVLERTCRTSGLWNQFRYLCDVFLVQDDGQVQWFRELPLQAVTEGQFGDRPHYYTLTFEWGRWDGDPMAVARHPRGEDAHRSVFLHPVLRRYEYAEVVDDHHVLEDLFGIYAGDRERGAVLSHDGLEIQEYHERHHANPLNSFFARHLSAETVG